MNAPKIEERVFLLPDEDKYACAAVRLLHALVLRAGEPALDDGRQGGRTRPPPLELQRARVRGRPRPHTGPVPPADGRRVVSAGLGAGDPVRPDGGFRGRPIAGMLPGCSVNAV